ncbi:hypothetical protein ISS06_00615 [Patescibacteria group bacterium]|nr:hypothetical protein [Patescibacteria group bacterium]
MSNYNRNGLNSFWRQSIHPIISLIMLGIITFGIFFLGAVFVREYVKIWAEIEQHQQQRVFFPEKETFLKKTILP